MDGFVSLPVDVVWEALSFPTAAPQADTRESAGAEDATEENGGGVVFNSLLLESLGTFSSSGMAEPLVAAVAGVVHPETSAASAELPASTIDPWTRGQAGERTIDAERPAGAESGWLRAASGDVLPAAPRIEGTEETTSPRCVELPRLETKAPNEAERVGLNQPAPGNESFRDLDALRLMAASKSAYSEPAVEVSVARAAVMNVSAVPVEKDGLVDAEVKFQSRDPASAQSAEASVPDLKATVEVSAQEAPREASELDCAPAARVLLDVGKGSGINGWSLVEIMAPSDESKGDGAVLRQVHGRALAKVMAADLQEGERREITLRLDPPSLGRVTVRVQQQGDRLMVVITASTAEAEAALRRGADGLVRAIALHAGGQEAEVEVRLARNERADENDENDQNDRDDQQGRRENEDSPDQRSAQQEADTRRRLDEQDTYDNQYQSLFDHQM